MGIVDDGIKINMNRTFKSVPDYTEVSKFKVGTGTTTYSFSDSDLVNPVIITGGEDVDTCEVITGWSANLTNSVSLNGARYVKGAGAINLIKSDITSTEVSVEKATTLLDFTSKKLFIAIYISTSTLANLATTNCLEIRYGSDNANYYYYTRNKTNLSSGWNWIIFNTTTASTTGVPDVANCDYTKIIITTDDTTDTILADNLVYDAIMLGSSDDFLKSFEVGYPSFDYTTDEVTVRCELSAADVVGFSISEFGVFNTDATRLMMNREVFLGISKTSSDVIIFIQKYRFLHTCT